MTRISNLQTAGFDTLVDNLPALLLIFKFALLSEYAAESEKLLIVSGSGKQGVPEQVH